MKKGLKSLILVLFLIIIFPKNAYALTFKVERSSDTIKVGSDVTIYIKAEGVTNDAISNYNIGLSYDTSKLEVKSINSDIANISNANPISITNKEGMTIASNGTVATIVFGVKSGAKAGSSNLTLTSADVKTASGKNVTATNTSSMVTVAELGTDATLSSLKIPNTTLTPKFDKNTTDYEASIKDITEITINAVAADSNAKIMISENYKKLVKGENIIKVSVTAENGQVTKTYNIKVNLSLTPTEEEKLKASTLLKNIKVKNYDIDFSSDTKKYILNVPYKVNKLKISAEAENPNSKIEIDKANNLKVGKNIIKILVTSEDAENTDTYQLTVTREKEEKKIVQTCPDEVSTNEWIIFSVSMFLTFTLGIVLGYFLCKKEVLKKLFKKKEKKENSENIDTLSDTIKIDTKKVNDKVKKTNSK